MNRLHVAEQGNEPQCSVCPGAAGIALLVEPL